MVENTPQILTLSEKSNRRLGLTWHWEIIWHRQKMKEIQENTKVMVKQNEFREKEFIFKKMILKGIKEEKKEDLLKKL